ncbi:hypothetical protein GIB67_030281 [Kingdonia uniflora]|uniref:Pentatricopeptide repeat-containing protein n=1 Tax=Kingdonia uniflora TaxID=39325 RepID=A0A7J7M6P4_9MAGN|nr:hypothetical protein GIB67_030281 [Kingdonia uniflora]
MSNRDIGSWNSLISSLAQNSEGAIALVLFREMQVEGVKGIFLLYLVSVLSVCTDLAVLINGKQFHGMVIKHGFGMYRPIGNATLNMYAKCGCMDEASLCFGNIVSKNVISWTSLIIDFCKNGLGDEALKAFGQMEMEGVVPNKITFLGVLYACSHARLVQEGLKHFTIMINSYCFTTMIEHYTFMVDLLARFGYLEQALEFIEEKMPVKPDTKLHITLLSSCYFHKNVELAKSVGKRLLELEPREAGAYMLLSNFYGRDLEGVVQVRRLMMDRGIRKEKACTWIEINRRVHAFESGDRSHPLHRYIHNYLDVLIKKMKANDYMPNTSLVVQNVDE